MRARTQPKGTVGERFAVLPAGRDSKGFRGLRVVGGLPGIDIRLPPAEWLHARIMLRLLYRFTAFSLALLWMPLTLCCSAEAAIGDEFSLCGDDCADRSPEGGQRDGCALVEDGKYSGSVAVLKVSAGNAVAGTGSVILSLAVTPPQAPPAMIRPAEPERPRDWVPTWQFERRAAAPAHAPDAVIG